MLASGVKEEDQPVLRERGTKEGSHFPWNWSGGRSVRCEVAAGIRRVRRDTDRILPKVRLKQAKASEVLSKCPANPHPGCR